MASHSPSSLRYDSIRLHDHADGKKGHRPSPQARGKARDDSVGVSLIRPATPGLGRRPLFASTSRSASLTRREPTPLASPRIEKRGLVALGRGIGLESAPGRWVLDVPRLSVLDFNIAETIHALILQNFDPRLGLMRGFGLLHRGGAWGQDGLRRHGQGQEG